MNLDHSRKTGRAAFGQTAAVVCFVAPLVLMGLADSPATTEVSVPGRSNATASMAADGEFVALVWGATAPGGRTDVYVATSRDGGATFGAPAQIDHRVGEARLGGEMPPRIALHRATAGRDPEIVVLWTAKTASTEIRIARSADAGRSFQVTTLEGSAPGDRGWPSLALDSRGQAHAVWLDHRGLADQAGASHHHAGHDPASSATTRADGVAMAQRSGLYYAGPGQPPASPREVLKGVCYCCKTALAVGWDGTLYAAWRHVYPGNIRDVAFTRSEDGGRTFSPPVRVSEDRWQLDGCPDDGPAMAVDGKNVVHLVWPTVIGGEEPEGALFYSSTRDGRTFTERQRIPTLGSPKPSHPQIVVGTDGRVVVAWDELRSGVRTVALRELRPDAAGRVRLGAIQTLTAGRSGSYPVLAAASRAVLAAWTQPAPQGGPSTIVVKRIGPEAGPVAP
jgi:hypothetical protein